MNCTCLIILGVMVVIIICIVVVASSTEYINYHVRQKFYKRARRVLIAVKHDETNTSPLGFCWLIDEHASWYMPKTIHDYPELMAYRPDDAGSWWFHPWDRDVRIAILDKIID